MNDKSVTIEVKDNSQRKESKFKRQMSQHQTKKIVNGMVQSTNDDGVKLRLWKESLHSTGQKLEPVLEGKSSFCNVAQ